MKLVIVESPAKAKTIQKYLGAGFIVKSSFGHVRDLPKGKLGIDVDDNFEPSYVIPVKAKKVIAELKKQATKAETIYLATDEDREGEAISWHLVQALKLPPSKTKRITFTEITKDAIQKAVASPRELDINLINAQQARRVLDRLVGYELSPLLWKKIRYGLSAGRVQSVAVRLIVEREEEIKAFKPEEYWSLEAELKKDSNVFKARLTQDHGAKLDKLDLKNKEQVDGILKGLEKAEYKVSDVKTQERAKNPPAPFTTSTLQQASFNTLGFSSKKTMMLAQQLYEGIELGSEGPVGFITYMRTDSTNLSVEATNKATEVIKSNYGERYTIDTPRQFKKKAKGAQEAHEAIRPTDPARLPELVSSHLSKDQLRLYQLIWRRFMGSQMAAAKYNVVMADITANDYLFRASGTTLLFDGYRKLFNDVADEAILPELKTGDALEFQQLLPEQHFTEPPARYSEATLVKAMEEKGIGRPSTYAPTIDTIQKREYVTKGDDKRFRPTEIGGIVTNLLTANFPTIVDLDFTAAMEENLDNIATGDKEWQPVMKSFYTDFHQSITNAGEKLTKEEFTQEKTGEKCPTCGEGEVIIKLGRFGKFKACSNYPTCKYTEAMGDEKKLQEELTGEICPDCGKPLVVKRGRFGPFLGCSGYPECKHIKKIEKSTGVTCPVCEKGQIIEKRSRKGKPFFACNRYPDCKNAYWSKPTGEKCPNCQSLLLYGAKNTVKCSSKECGFTKEAEAQD